MKQFFRWKTVAIIASLLLICTLFPLSAAADEDAGELMPYSYTNLSNYLIRDSFITETDNGYMTVYNDDTKSGKILIEYYDDSFHILDKKAIDLELSVWGGFYEGSDAYYLVEGQHNPNEIDTQEVLRVIKYDKDWNRLGAASITGNPAIFGGDVGYIFSAGSVEMTEQAGHLYIVTGHRGYVDESVGQGHQGLLLIDVDEEELTGEVMFCNLYHSFTQRICSEENYLYLLEKSEGNYATTLTVFDLLNERYIKIPALKYGGKRTSAWAIPVYASVDDVAVSDSHIFGIGTSIDQSLYEEYASATTSFNIYLSITPKDDISSSSTTVKWLTENVDDGQSFLGLTLTKINDNRFLVAWNVYESDTEMIGNDPLSVHTLHYLFIDGNGDVVSEEYTAPAPMSGCHPILSGDKVVYYAMGSNVINFYEIDINTGDFQKIQYNPAGEFCEWDLADGIFTIRGKGAVTLNGFDMGQTSLPGNPRGQNSGGGLIKNQTERIVVGNGITEINKSAFSGFSYVKTVDLGSDVTTIGDRAFYGEGKLRKIYIPSSVQSIANNALWSGSYWNYNDQPAVFATIYCEEGSYAQQYAIDNDISYKIVGIKLDQTELSLEPGQEKTIKADVSVMEPELNPTEWSSSDESVAIVDENGKVTAVGIGSATITAETFRGRLRAECEVTVLPHSMHYVEAVPAGCETSGNIEYWVCDTCGLLFADPEGVEQISLEDTVLDAIGHNPQVVERVEPTCTEDGSTEGLVCANCGQVYQAIETIPALGHTWGAWEVITPPTDEEDGEATRECSVCGEVQTRSIPNLLHEHQMISHEAHDVTCTENGNIAYWECQDCGWFFLDPEGVEEIDEDAWIIRAQGHQILTQTAVEPTCTEAGWTEDSRCSVCGEVFKEKTVIPALGHAWTEWEMSDPFEPTNDGLDKRHCTRCGKEEIRESDWVIFFYGYYSGLVQYKNDLVYLNQGAEDPTYSGLQRFGQDWYYVRNGRVDFSYNGLQNNSSGWWKIENGKVNFGFKGFARNEYGWWYLEDGKVNFSKTGVINGIANTDSAVDGESAWWYVEGGKVTAATTVANNEYGWWYVKDGKVDFSYTGLAQNSNGWWYIKDGKVDFNYNGFARNEYGWWYCEKGQITFKKNDIISGKANTDPTAVGVDGWWYVVKSQVIKTNTVASNAYGWWFVRDGKVDFGYTGVQNNSNGWWYIKDGKVDFNYTGFGANEHGWWYCEKGQVKFNKNDIISGKANTDPAAEGVDGWWYVVKSQVIKTDTVAQNVYGWWAIFDGKVDFTFTGLADNDYGTWYCVNGKVDFNYTGTFEGRSIVKGKAQ